MTETEVRVVGLSFRHVTAKLKPGDRVRLVPESDNKWDPNALAIYFGDDHLGYVGKKDPLRLKMLAKAKKEEVTLPVLVANYYKEGDEKLWEKVQEGDLVQLWLRAFSLAPIDDNTFTPITSFTGEEVLWSEYHHICTDLKGNELLGGSTYASQFTQDFDSERIAKAYAEKNDYEVDDVLNYWSSLGDVSMDYGTAIHKAMEHYCRFYDMVGHNMALPRQEHLREAVEAFLRVSDFEDCMPEPLITDVEKGMSGWIDLLRFSSAKTVSIEDYKTNTFNSQEDYEKKWPAKVQEYKRQFDFYGTILQNHGYTVVGTVLWHWHNSEWNQHVLEFEPVKEYMR